MWFTLSFSSRSLTPHRCRNTELTIHLILSALTGTYMLTGWTEPLSIGDDHERRPQTGCVVAAVTRIAQQDLRKRYRQIVTQQKHFSQQRKKSAKLAQPIESNYSNEEINQWLFFSCLPKVTMLLYVRSLSVRRRFSASDFNEELPSCPSFLSYLY